MTGDDRPTPRIPIPPSRASDLQPGALIARAYRILTVKEGGQGIVCICERVQDQAHVALKTFKSSILSDATADAFEREARIWLRLSGVVHVLPAMAVIRHHARPFVEMLAIEPPPGVALSLRELLRAAVPAPKALKLAADIAVGMKLAGRRLQGLVHGDLKPENILFLEDMTMISDFGLAFAERDRRDAAGADSTWAYMPPEWWASGLGAIPRTAQGDVYGYGVVLYELLTGSLPWRANSHAEWARAHTHVAPAPPASGA